MTTSGTTHTGSTSIFNLCQYDPLGLCDTTVNTITSYIADGKIWANTCSAKIQEQYFSDQPKDPQVTNNPAYEACIGPNTTLGKIAAGVSSMADTAAPWLRSSLNTIFPLYNLPELPQDINSGQITQAPWATAALVGSIAIPYFFSAKIPAMSSLSSGGLLGAGTSLLFGQDPRIGALVGAISKLAIDTIGNYATAPFKKIYQSTEKALKPYINVANTLVSAAFIVGIGYHFNTLKTLATQNPWAAATTGFAAASQFHSIWKLYQMKGALSLASSLATFCITHIHYPVIAYLSIAAQSPELHNTISQAFQQAPIAWTGASIGTLGILLLGHSLFPKAPPPPPLIDYKANTPRNPTISPDPKRKQIRPITNPQLRSPIPRMQRHRTSRLPQ